MSAGFENEGTLSIQINDGKLISSSQRHLAIDLMVEDEEDDFMAANLAASLSIQQMHLLFSKRSLYAKRVASKANSSIWLIICSAPSFVQ